uniref:Uncharacterized protein n=1 Tax=viral metagenome TaxID=1070528 RepID=A0A6H1ZC51_9ZZZZ
MSNLHTTAMLVNLSISQWSARKYDRNVSRKIEEEYNAQDAGRYNKLLIAKEGIEKIQKIASKARIFHYTNTLPWNDNGDRILPSANFYTYADGVRDLKSTFEKMVSKFLEVYPDLKEDARFRLNAMFKEEDYPHVLLLPDKFNFVTSFMPIPDSSDFRVDLADTEIERIKKEIEDCRREREVVAMKDLWSRVYTAVNHMVERLSEEKSKFKDSLVGNIAEICQLLPKLNINNDANLNAMGAEIAAKLTTVEPETLRKDKDTRKEVCSSAEDILKKMEGYIK